MPKVAVAMSVPGGVKCSYLVQAVESILGQTFRDLEFVIVTDGPLRRELADFLARTREADRRVKLLSNGESLGLAASMNRIIQETDSPYLARMDADDVSLPERIERQIKYLESHPHIEMAGTFAHEIDAAGRVLFSKRLPVDLDRIRRWMARRDPFVHPTVVFRRTFFERVGLYAEYRSQQDTELWIRALGRGIQASNIPEFLYLFRVDESFWANRTGLRYAWRETKLRAAAIRELNLPLANYLFVPAHLVLRMCPKPVARFLYRHFR